MSVCSTMLWRLARAALVAAVTVSALSGVGAGSAVASSPAAVQNQLRQLHLHPTPLYPPTLPHEFHDASATLDRHGHDFDVSFVRVRGNVSNLAVTLRRAGPELLGSVVPDPRHPQIGQTRLRGLKVYSFKADLSFGYVWHEQGRTYQILAKYY